MLTRLFVRVFNKGDERSLNIYVDGIIALANTGLFAAKIYGKGVEEFKKIFGVDPAEINCFELINDFVI
jgi:hypothetical protein